MMKKEFDNLTTEVFGTIVTSIIFMVCYMLLSGFQNAMMTGFAEYGINALNILVSLPAVGSYLVIIGIILYIKKDSEKYDA